MRILKSNLLNDGKLFNDGRPVDLIQIEKDEDFDILLDSIIQTGYYNTSYFDTHIDYRPGEVKFDAYFLASMLHILQPRSVLELGCGRGDVLFLLGLDPTIRVSGIEFSTDILETVWPPLANKIECGDILDVCRKFKVNKVAFDTFCAYDLWEHLHPRRLSDYIETIVSLAEKDALFFFSIPAFGEDRIFGEIFPLELEENRERFDQRLPLKYLNAESTNPPIPANGHLIWAHTEWWQKQFEAHGLIRAETLEKNIHAFFDEHLFYARKSFYIFHIDSSQARKRVDHLLKNPLTLFRKWKVLVKQQESLRKFEEQCNSSYIDLAELKSTLHHAEFYMNLDIKKKIEEWASSPLKYKMTNVFIRPVLPRLKKWIFDYWENYVTSYKKNHYRF